MISDDLLKKTLENIAKSPVAYDYFFNNINNPAWLLPLKEKGFFKNPTPAIRKDGYIQFPVWSEGGYLVRVADKAEDVVLEIIKALPDTDNERVMDDVVKALLKINTTKAARLTDVVKKYVNSSGFLLLHHTASEFVCKLADNSQTEQALGLAKEMLDVLPDPEKEEKLKEDFAFIKPVTKYRGYDYNDIVKKITPSLMQNAPLATIDMYAGLLQSALDYEFTHHKDSKDERADDFSYIWWEDIAQDIEHADDAKDALATALRDSVVALMKNNSVNDTEKLSKLKDLAVNKYSVFKRIVEFGLRKHKDNTTFKLFYDSLVKDKQLKGILDREKSGVGKMMSGFVTEKPTNVLKDLPDTELIEKLKTYKDESDWSFERDSIAKELAELVQSDPKRFVPLVKDIAATKNEYLDEAIRAFESIADELDTDSVNKIIESLTEIYTSISTNKEKERHDYYAWSKSSTIRLIEKLLGKKEDKSERITSESLAPITKLLLLLCREENPSSEDNSSFEPTDLSINSTRGTALHAVAHLLAWMNRNKVDKVLYKPVIDELDWHLNPDNDPSPAIRSVYGWHFAFLYGTDSDWATKNIHKIFTKDKLGASAFDAYVMFNSAHPDALEILGDVFVEQLPRLATAPVDDGKSRHDGMENFVQHLALHYWYGVLDLSDGSMMNTLLNTADTKYVKELANFVGFRLYKSKSTDTPAEQIEKLIELWNAIVKTTQDRSATVEALEEFGTWFASGKFDPKWSLEQLAYSASKAGEIHLDFAALEYMETLATKHPAESLKALSAMIDGTKERWSVSSWSKNATAIIKTAYRSSNADVKESAKALANKLVAKGYIEYRNIIT